MKDKRFFVIQNLIETGKIESFAEIFEYVPKTTVYKKLGMNYGRFITLTKNPEGFKLKELVSLSNLIGLSDPKLIVDLAFNQYLNSKKGKR